MPIIFSLLGKNAIKIELVKQFASTDAKISNHRECFNHNSDPVSSDWSLTEIQSYVVKALF